MQTMQNMKPSLVVIPVSTLPPEMQKQALQQQQHQSFPQLSEAQLEAGRINPVRERLAGMSATELAPDVQKVNKMVVAMRQNDRLLDAVQIMTQRGFHSVPVVKTDIGQVVGLLSLDDVTAYLSQRIMPHARSPVIFGEPAQPRAEPVLIVPAFSVASVVVDTPAGGAGYGSNVGGQQQQVGMLSADKVVPFAAGVAASVATTAVAPQFAPAVGAAVAPAVQPALASQVFSPAASSAASQATQYGVSQAMQGQQASSQTYGQGYGQQQPMQGPGQQQPMQGLQGGQAPIAVAKATTEPVMVVPAGAHATPAMVVPASQIQQRASQQQQLHHADSALNYPITAFIPPQETVGNVMGYSGRNPLELVLDSHKGAQDVVSVLAKPNGPARIIVVDENRRVVALISRADIIRWAYTNSERPEFRRLLNKNLLDINFKTESFKSVPKHEPLRRALDLISRDVLAVTDPSPQSWSPTSPSRSQSGRSRGGSSGRLVSSFSSEDLKKVFSHTTGPNAIKMSMSLEDYARATSAYPLRPRTVRMRSTLGEIARDFVETRSHLLWFVDDNGSPAGYFSQADFVEAIFHSKTSSALNEFLTTTRAIELASPQQKSERRVIAIRAWANLTDAVNLLSTHKILAAPIVTDMVTGILSLEDVATYLAFKSSPMLQPQSDQAQQVTQQPSGARTAVSRLAGTSEQTVSDSSQAASSITGRGLYSYIDRDTTVQTVQNWIGKRHLEMIRESDDASLAVKMLCGDQRRVLLMDNERRVRALLTQSDVIRYLYNNREREEYRDLFARPLRYLGFGPKPVNTVRRSYSLRRVLEAFRLGQHRALAVVDDDQGGRLVGNFSASDVKLLFPPESGSTGAGTSTTTGGIAQSAHAPSLDISLGQFLDQFSQSSLKPELASLDWSMLELTRRFVDSRLHHFWLVDSYGRPDGVISQTDFLRALQKANL